MTTEQRLKQVYNLLLSIHRDIDSGQLLCLEYHLEIVEGIEQRVTSVKYAVHAEVMKNSKLLRTGDD